MDERELIKKVIGAKLAGKEEIRAKILAGIGNRKGVVSMKRKLVTVALSLVLVVAMSYGVYAVAENIEYNRAEDYLGEIGVNAQEISRSQAKQVYRDMRTEEFELEITKEVLDKRANDLGLEYVPVEAEHVYRALKNYSALTSTHKVTADQVEDLEAGLTYGEIIDILGVTKDVGKDSYILQYLVDGNKLLTLSFNDEEDICPLSGQEMLETLKKIATENNTELSFNATILQNNEGSLLVDCPAYDKFDSAYVGITEETAILFNDGNKAVREDLTVGSAVVITYSGTIRESYPVQIDAVKIVIQN